MQRTSIQGLSAEEERIVEAKAKPSKVRLSKKEYRNRVRAEENRKKKKHLAEKKKHLVILRAKLGRENGVWEYVGELSDVPLPCEPYNLRDSSKFKWVSLGPNPFWHQAYYSLGISKFGFAGGPTFPPEYDVPRPKKYERIPGESVDRKPPLPPVRKSKSKVRWTQKQQRN